MLKYQVAKTFQDQKQGEIKTFKLFLLETKIYPQTSKERS